MVAVWAIGLARDAQMLDRVSELAVGASDALAIAVAQTLKPVSYTHLDVYKRQGIRRMRFIDEIHTLVGAGAAEGAIDAASILKPVSYTHLDVYKRQRVSSGSRPSARRTAAWARSRERCPATRWA